eukprot:Blabericola_migrator_1__6726@NODE_33_length_18162_cov_161_418900_g29_i0_p3_GENE_NODE_33_length_18162_cov_161_418900_g29_i0NODE_33_length_18162_cov_161_418900_g29_i0_p3_ORF_typecomplete_len651_score141_96CENPF_leu_zip/PF10473_9/1_2CENPF_leu_zip/PF10473_9/1_2CENPF_leu_zip/PF10473_9/0_0075CALCOCO1/PF07888_11/1_3CALCOCO1/PF07888_11/0_076APG6_N/PF17675_1/1_3e02APG6_N/PF17675_1/6_5e02APG6_N/PF17675_1/0_0041DUF3584/PF12128_8/0_012ATG16/PF08614_11/6_7e02ATG16/PF08614_11/1_3ATG16/PF08614_11/0_01Myosin_ta
MRSNPYRDTQEEIYTSAGYRKDLANKKQTIYHTRGESESDVDEDRFLYESKFLGTSSGGGPGNSTSGSARPFISTSTVARHAADDPNDINPLALRLSALGQYKVMIKRTLDRYSDDGGQYKSPVSPPQMKADIKEVCELALDLNAAVATMSEELEQLMAVKQDLEEVRADDQARIKDLEERGEEAVVHWKRKYERAIEELESAEKLLYDQRSSTRGQATLSYDDTRHSSLERKTQAEVERLEMEKQALQQKLAEVSLELRERHANEIAQLDSLYTELQQDRDAVSRRLGDAIRDRNALDMDLRSLQQNNEALRLELDRMTRRQNDLVKRLIALSEENQNLHGSLQKNDSPSTKLSLEEAIELFIHRTQEDRGRTGDSRRPAYAKNHTESVEIEGVPPPPPEIVIQEVPVVKETEVIKEVPVEVIKEVEVVKEVPIEIIKEIPVEVIREVEVPIEVIKHVEVIKEVPVEVIREVEVPVEVIKHVEVVKEVPVEVIREVEVVKEVPVEKIVEVQVEVLKEVPVEVVREVEVIREVPVERTIEVPVVREVERIVEVPIIKESVLPENIRVGDREIHIHLHTHQHDHAHQHDHSHSHYHQYNASKSPNPAPRATPTTPDTCTPNSGYANSVLSGPASASVTLSTGKQLKVKKHV